MYGNIDTSSSGLQTQMRWFTGEREPIRSLGLSLTYSMNGDPTEEHWAAPWRTTTVPRERPAFVDHEPRQGTC